jgi:hypothetical protein
MKVKDLIEKLEKSDPESSVLVVDEQSALYVPRFCEEEEFVPKAFENGEREDLKKIKTVVMLDIAY